MASKVINEKGFLVIKMNYAEGRMLNFGLREGILCGRCLKLYDGSTDEPIYYVAVLNEVFCEDCYNKWVSTAKRYGEDIPYEIRNYNRIASDLGCPDEELEEEAR